MVEFVRTFLDGHALTGVILLATLKVSVLLLAALGINAALRSASASLRHLVWSVAIGAVLVVPALTALVPRWDVPVPATVGRQTPATASVELADAPALTAASARETKIAAPADAVSDPAPDRAWTASAGNARGEASAATADAVTAEAASATAAGGRAGDFTWMTWLVAIWLAGALVSCGAIGLALIRTWLLGRRAERLGHGRAVSVLEELRGRMGIGRRVGLLRCRGRCMPMTWGVVDPAILLPADIEEWPESRIRAVLLHELAHIKRFDYLTQLLARLVCALHWFNPLAWLAAARLRVERELACDDEVLLSGSRASEYAGHLVEMARSLKERPLPALATVAMARPSRLGDRVRAVLDGSRARRALTIRVVVSVWLVALGLTLPVAAATPEARAEGPTPEAESRDDTAERASPAQRAAELDGVARPALAVDRDARGRGPVNEEPAAVPAGVQSCDWLGEGHGTSTSINVEDDDWRIKVERGRCELEFELHGDLEFDDRFTRVVGISSGGELEIEETEGRSSKRATLRQRDGRLERRWYVNGDERDFDAAAEAWLSDILLVLFRRAGYLAEERATSILERGGVDALMQEVSHIASDYVARKYYTVLLSQRDLRPEQVRDIVRQVGRDIGSDYELAELLIAIARNHPLDESVRIAYVEASSSIGSDYEQRRVLSAILDRDELSQELAHQILRLATEISSDYELAELLIEVISRRPLDGSMVASFFDAVESISSDYETRRVIDTAIKQGPPNEEFLDRALESAQEIGSDYELAELLIDVASMYPVEERLPAAYLSAARSISSDYELARVLRPLVIRGDASKATLRAVLRLAAGISSDHELSRLLVTIARGYELDEELRVEYMRAADTLGSEYERGRAVSALYPRGSGTGSGGNVQL
ncbi:MAG: hypothetical protein GWN99_07545 [Gemmatimonadetes bacterium]|nr:hypothetical protein [Gemmatimonadota bacterium]NIS00914.1 hypothetical protein [Gemmatimonadota bacterium]NIT66531.1 hypothetical protein [Gemmatimonadota bacterium]NIU52877.1 hypothetical protein [Gemmatimonadota bacterium]NIV23065.1 hypothetical protein [Gemmatimonadota bacterium]